MEIKSDRLVAQINLKNIKHNLMQYKDAIQNKKIKYLAVIKADAYGHGASEVAKYLQNDVDYFAVATSDEALELRKSEVENEVLLLGVPFTDELDSLIINDITLSVGSLSVAKEISLAAEKLGKTAKVHIKLDTGMSRLGFLDYEDYVSEVKEVSGLSNVEITGVYSHFAEAENKDDSFTKSQNKLFVNMCDNIRNAGVDLGVRHIANSSGALFPDYSYDMVRIGIGLYGYDICRKMSEMDLKPAMRLTARTIAVKKLQKGRTVGYGRTYKTESDEYIQTISIGYADGLSRHISGKDFPVHYADGNTGVLVGNVCMDQAMVKTSKPVDVGTEAYIFGYDKISGELLAKYADTIIYEILTGIKRVKRVYIK